MSGEAEPPQWSTSSGKPDVFLMRGGFVYGRFVSDGPGPPYGCRIEEMPEADCAGHSGISDHEASLRHSAGHSCFQFIIDEKPAFCFWVGRGGFCRAGGRERSLAEGSPYIYGINRRPVDEASLRNLLLCSEKSLVGEGFRKLLFCTEERLSPGFLSVAGLSLIGTYSSASPKLLCLPAEPYVPFQQRAAESLRQRMPGLFSILSGLLSASALRKCLFCGTVSGKKFTILFNGPPQMANYYSGVLFGPQARCMPGPGFLENRPAAHDVEMEWRSRGAGARPGTTALPSFSRSVLELGSSFDDFVSSLGDSAQKDIKKINKNRLSSALSHDVLDFLLFYHTMYLPMVGSRHGRHSLYVSFKELLSYFCAGFLMFIIKESIPVAALLAIPCGKVLVGKTMGIRAGSPEHTYAGANSAIIYFHIKNAYEMGCAAIDLGYSSPFGCDGVLRFKSKWHVRLVADRNIDLLCMRFGSEEVKRAFFSACLPLPLEELDAYDPPRLTS
jgi:hypothetical protein